MTQQSANNDFYNKKEKTAVAVRAINKEQIIHNRNLNAHYAITLIHKLFLLVGEG